jgi:beta-xylosidase
MYKLYLPFIALVVIGLSGAAPIPPQTSGNPIFEGWYADPEIRMFNDTFWVFPTYSDKYNKQVFFDVFSSTDLVTWHKHARVMDTSAIKWAWRAMWAPSVVEKQGKFYFFFGANDIQSNAEKGGIGVAVANHPGGPYRDYLGKPLVDQFYNGAQPIDQFVFQDNNGQYYLIYGGWGHCNIAQLNPDFTGFIPFPDGSVFKEITPEGYVEGSFMFYRKGKYYFMWSEGGWTGPDYSVAYAIADTPLGPFQRIGKILQQDARIATGAGHHSVIKAPGKDKWYIAYHRRPLGQTDGNARQVCLENLYFDKNGRIKPVVLTNTGVKQTRIKKGKTQ